MVFLLLLFVYVAAVHGNAKIEALNETHNIRKCGRSCGTRFELTSNEKLLAQNACFTAMLTVSFLHQIVTDEDTNCYGKETTPVKLLCMTHIDSKTNW